MFEVHITGCSRIHEVAKPLGLKTIEIDLLATNGRVIRTEHMTSFIDSSKSFAECLAKTRDYAEAMKVAGVEVYREKIETGPREDLIDQAIYIESHFDSYKFEYPTSCNVNKIVPLATDREYDPSKFREFKEKYKDVCVEICLYDTFVDEDMDWFTEYGF